MPPPHASSSAPLEEDSSRRDFFAKFGDHKRTYVGRGGQGAMLPDSAAAPSPSHPSKPSPQRHAPSPVQRTKTQRATPAPQKVDPHLPPGRTGGEQGTAPRGLQPHTGPTRADNHGPPHDSPRTTKAGKATPGPLSPRALGGETPTRTPVRLAPLQGLQQHSPSPAPAAGASATGHGPSPHGRLAPMPKKRNVFADCFADDDETPREEPALPAPKPQGRFQGRQGKSVEGAEPAQPPQQRQQATEAPQPQPKLQPQPQPAHTVGRRSPRVVPKPEAEHAATPAAAAPKSSPQPRAGKAVAHATSGPDRPGRVAPTVTAHEPQPHAQNPTHGDKTSVATKDVRGAPAPQQHEQRAPPATSRATANTQPPPPAVEHPRRASEHAKAPQEKKGRPAPAHETAARQLKQAPTPTPAPKHPSRRPSESPAKAHAQTSPPPPPPPPEEVHLPEDDHGDVQTDTNTTDGGESADPLHGRSVGDCYRAYKRMQEDVSRSRFGGLGANITMEVLQKQEQIKKRTEYGRCIATVALGLGGKSAVRAQRSLEEERRVRRARQLADKHEREAYMARVEALRHKGERDFVNPYKVSPLPLPSTLDDDPHSQKAPSPAHHRPSEPFFTTTAPADGDDDGRGISAAPATSRRLLGDAADVRSLVEAAPTPIIPKTVLTRVVEEQLQLDERLQERQTPATPGRPDGTHIVLHALSAEPLAAEAAEAALADTSLREDQLQQRIILLQDALFAQLCPLLQAYLPAHVAASPTLQLAETDSVLMRAHKLALLKRLLSEYGWVALPPSPARHRGPSIADTATEPDAAAVERRVELPVNRSRTLSITAVTAGPTRRIVAPAPAVEQASDGLREEPVPLPAPTHLPPSGVENDPTVPRLRQVSSSSSIGSAPSQHRAPGAATEAASPTGIGERLPIAGLPLNWHLRCSVSTDSKSHTSVVLPTGATTMSLSTTSQAAGGIGDGDSGGVGTDNSAPLSPRDGPPTDELQRLRAEADTDQRRIAALQQELARMTGRT